MRPAWGALAVSGALGAGTAALAPLAVAAPAVAEPAASPAPATPSGDLVEGTPCTASAQACVELATDQAWLLDQGKVIRGPVPIKPGAPDEPTPTGTFTVQWKDEHHISDMPNHAPMPYSVFFAPGGVAFHEGSLQDYSAGCVHLAHDDAVAFYDTLPIGAQVQVHDDPASTDQPAGPDRPKG